MPDDITTGGATEAAQEPTAAVQDTASASAPKEQKGSWLDRFIRPWVGGDDSEASADASGDDGERTDGTDAGTKPAPITFSSQEEFDRAVQAETDRREAKRRAENETKEARERRLRMAKEDPLGLADEVLKEHEQEDQAGQVTGVFRQVGELYDTHTLTPLLSRLPEAEQQRIIAAAPEGLAGRKAIVDTALDVLLKRAKEEGAKEAEERARKNPAFRKELLTELRGSEEEPEGMASVGVTRTRDIDDWLRTK